MLSWRLAHFDKLTAREVHDLLQARAAVFVLEQACIFQDVDGADPACWHLVGRAAAAPGGEHGPLLAYCRLVPPGVKYAEPSIGRVLTTAAGRASGAGRALMGEAVARTGALWPGRAIRIGAQRYLEKFYGEFGFVQCSEPYDEDGIVHIEMLRAADNQENA
jgi:ElaA protein